MFHQLKQGSPLKLRDEVLQQKEQNSNIIWLYVMCVLMYYFAELLFFNTDNLLQRLDVEMWK